MKASIIRIVLCVLAAQCAATAAAAADEPVLTQGSLRFVSGGVGDDSDARMHARFADFNLRLLFAAIDGHYLADVAVTISDAGGSRVLDTVAQGPWLLASIAPGRYVVTAQYDGRTVTQKTTIAARGTRELVFRWQEARYSSE